MVNYQNGKIYKLVCNTTGLVYFGSTCVPSLARRLQEHKGDYSRGRKITSAKIIENGNYGIFLVETYPCNSKDELNMRERFYIENNECVNKFIPIRTVEEKPLLKVEYYEKNKEKIDAYQKDYYNDHKIELADYIKNYREINKDKIREIQKQYRNKEEAKVRHREANKRYCEKEETKVKRSEAYKREDVKAKKREADKRYQAKLRTKTFFLNYLKCFNV